MTVSLTLVEELKHNLTRFKSNPEVEKLKDLIEPSLWDCLADNGCWIAGGACTSVFTNKEVNDLDIYFPSKEAFQKVMLALYSYDNEYDVSYADGAIRHVSKKSILLKSHDQDVQFIVYKFFDSIEDLFRSYDFTINMCALNMKSEEFVSHELFMKHNAQKYLSFNPETDYPLVSALRVDKYVKRGYTISKAQMMKILLAVNKKNIDSWEVLIDEIGGMYGTAPEEIFDTTQPFSLDLAIETLNNKNFKDTVVGNAPDLPTLTRHFSDLFDKSFVEKFKAKNPYYNHISFDHIKD